MDATMGMAIRRFDFQGLQDFAAPVSAPTEVDTDHTLPEVEDQAPPPPPSFSEDELMAAKAAAWEEGRMAGTKEEAERIDADNKKREQAVEKAAEQLVKHAAQMLADYQSFKVQQTKELSALVMMLVQKVAGDALKHDPAGSIETMLDNCLGIMQSQPKFVVSVHPDIAPAIDAKLRDMVQKHHLEAAITVKVNEQLDMSEAKLEWPDGAASRDMNAVWEQVEAKINAIDFAPLADTKPDQPNNHQQGEQA